MRNYVNGITNQSILIISWDRCFLLLIVFYMWTQWRLEFLGLKCTPSDNFCGEIWPYCGIFHSLSQIQLKHAVSFVLFTNLCTSLECDSFFPNKCTTSDLIREFIMEWSYICPIDVISISEVYKYPVVTIPLK